MLIMPSTLSNKSSFRIGILHLHSDSLYFRVFDNFTQSKVEADLDLSLYKGWSSINQTNHMVVDLVKHALLFCPCILASCVSTDVLQ